MFAWSILLLLGAIWGASYMFIKVDHPGFRSPVFQTQIRL
jgi:drug/metabolite transporter (DMT)-like permease